MATRSTKDGVHLVFVPSPGTGHIFPMVELATHLISHHPTLSVTLCIMRMPFKSESSSFDFSSASYHHPRINFIDLLPPTVDPTAPPSKAFSSFLQGHAPQIRQILLSHNDVGGVGGPPLAALVLDMFCTSYMDCADDLGIPSYVFYTCGATFLGLMFHLQSLHHQGLYDPLELKDSDTTLDVPSLKSPLPGKLLPSAVVLPDWLPDLLAHTKRTRAAKGILVNTFHHLESHALASLAQIDQYSSTTTTPPPVVYPVGPIINLKVKAKDGDDSNIMVMEWLDLQPEGSVVFLCFGSMGSFEEEQVKEIALALERSGHRFLWSIRRPPPKSGGSSVKFPTDYEDVAEGLPEGFQERTAGMGKVIGWAPQTMVLGHPSVGGFVSHCGWNSTLESIWFGVPVAAWPQHAEQQLNAVLLVRELEVAEEIRMSYRKESGEVVGWEEIHRGIKEVMKADNTIRTKVKEMSEMSRKSVEHGGASYHSLDRFIQDVTNT